MSDFLSNVNAVYALLLAIAGGIVAFLIKARKEWASSKTNALMETAQQSGVASVLAALAGAQVREKEAWALVTQARVDHDRLMGDMGTMREDIAELRTSEENCQRNLQDFRNQLETRDITHRDEVRGNKNTIANQKQVILNQAREIRKLGGDPNITGILGDLG